MKKIISWILVLAILVALIEPFEKFLFSIKEQYNVNESMPTQQEMADFQKLISENTFYYFNRLNDSQKEAYATMYASFMSFDVSFFIRVAEDDIKSIFTAVLYDNPNIFWIDNKYKYIISGDSVSFTPAYRYTKDEARLITTQLNSVVDKVASYANTLNSDYEKELYIHDYVCKNTVYDESLSNIGGNSAYDSLIKGKAICEGYSRAIQILLNAVDIDNYIVTGDGESEPHMWNIVEIDNLNYHLDATWNDIDTDDEIFYLYFNVSDEMIEKNHSNIVPENNYCYSDTAFYYKVENSYIKSYNGFSEHINRSIDALKSGKNSVEFVFDNSNDYKKAINDVENNNGFFDYVSAVVRGSGRKLYQNEASYYTVEAQNYLCIIFKEE